MIRVRVSAVGTYNLDPVVFVDYWQEKCDNDEDRKEGDDYPPIPDEFALAKFKEELDSGEADLSTILETATIKVETL